MDNSANTNTTTPISPWGQKHSLKEEPSLADIMSEQLALDIHMKQERFAQRNSNAKVSSSDFVETKWDREKGPGDGEKGSETGEGPGCDSDEFIARMLQTQFDKEYDEMLKKTEDKYNGTSKVSVSFSNYRALPECFGQDSDSDSDVAPDERRSDWDSFTKSEREFRSVPKCGYRKLEDGGMVTKHDSEMAGRRNACRVMQFPPEFHTGDGGGFDMQLPNKVFNSLKAHSRHETSRRNRLHDKSDSATSEMGLDEKTRLILFKLVNLGVLEQVNGTLSTGKEAVILHADGGTADETIVPKECAIKVYKTTLNEFKTRDKYIRDDYRFRDRFSKQNPRKIVHLWAEKELHNLNRIKNAGIRCPEVVTLKKHVLVMSFIGENHRPAPKLKDAALDPEEMERAYTQTVACMRALYHRAELVHADLSEYNILWHENNCWFIDVSQAVERNHPRALEFLHRDCANVCAFFNRRGAGASVARDPAQLFDLITGGKDVADGTDEHRAAMLARVKDFEKNNELLTFDRPEKVYPFDYCWDQAQKQQV